MYFGSLGEMTPGRLLAGIASDAEDFLSWVGVSRQRPLANVERALGEIRYLLERGSEAPSGWDPSSPGLPSPRRTPLYIGAMSPRMLALAGRIADGVLPLLFPRAICRGESIWCWRVPTGPAGARFRKPCHFLSGVS